MKDSQTNRCCLPYSLKAAEEIPLPLKVIQSKFLAPYAVFHTFRDTWKNWRPESPLQGDSTVWLPEFFMPQCSCQGSDCLKALIQFPLQQPKPSQLQPPSLKKSLLQRLSPHHFILLKKHILSQKNPTARSSLTCLGSRLVMARLVCRVGAAWSKL